MGLTIKRIARIKRPGRYADGDRSGLYLQVTNTGVKSWLFIYQRGPRVRYMGLGPLHTINLAEARERARRARQQLLDGIDPLEARKAERSAAAAAAARALTFAEAARRYFDAHEKLWTNSKHRDQFLSSLQRYAFPQLGARDVATIDTASVLRVIEPIWSEKVITADRVRGRIENILDWATVRGHRSGDNPARWKGHLSEVLPARSAMARPVHHPALNYAEIAHFMTALRERPGSAARALEFTILTAARTGAVIGAQWDEIDLAKATWKIPAGRMKASREHRVPLSSIAIKLLKELYREQDNRHVFIGAQKGSGLSDMAMAVVLRRMSVPVTVHGFRSTFSDWAHERTAYSNHEIELSLAHSIGTAVEQAYRRGDLFDKRRKLMEDWGRFCSAPAAPPGAEVVPLRGRGGHESKTVCEKGDCS
jgi:integrase